ncbi:PH domain-containing protein [Halomarina litorea]|uniref:PH domain-containing protein n=1 Tax=Halomarina litorea TaxID=2961595 RepID=UPI0020C2802F|nr:PH domain-containing protein [Halomarina sp. BCD28]
MTAVEGERLDVEPPAGTVRTLDPNVRVVWAAQALVSALVAGVVVGIASSIVRGPLWAGPAAFALLGALGVALSVARYRVWRYQVREDSLFLERGVFTRTKTVVPYVRIQHVDSSRGPLERAVGLASAVVYTAGSRGADVTIPGLIPEDAEALQDRLKRLAIAAEGEDAV